MLTKNISLNAENYRLKMRQLNEKLTILQILSQHQCYFSIADMFFFVIFISFCLYNI